jgi:hypothetical protein
MIEWTRAGQWHEVSDCGRYKVCAAKIDGKYVFQAWCGSKPGEILHTGEVEQCRSACDTHRARGEGV